MQGRRLQTPSWRGPRAHSGQSPSCSFSGAGGRATCSRPGRPTPGVPTLTTKGSPHKGEAGEKPEKGHVAAVRKVWVNHAGGPFKSPGPPRALPSPSGPAQPEKPESHPPCYPRTLSDKWGSSPCTDLALSPGRPNPWEEGSCCDAPLPLRLGNAWHPKGSVGRASTPAGSSGPAEPSSVQPSASPRRRDSATATATGRNRSS